MSMPDYGPADYTADELASWASQTSGGAPDRRKWARQQRRQAVQRRRRLLTAHETLIELIRCVRDGDVVATDGPHPTRDAAEILTMAADVRHEYVMCRRLLAALDHVLATAT